MRRLLLCLLVLIGSAGLAKAQHVVQDETIRFGLTAVVVRENLRFLDKWAYYLSGKMGQPVEFVRRRSYREEMDLLESRELDFAWICGFPFIQNRDPEFIELLAVPVYNGEPLYRSYVIVHKDSPYRSLDDLRGKVFAYSDPESNSGFLYPQFLLMNKNETSESFFRQTFFTFNHAETVEAVAAQFADGGAVDSYIWDFLRKTQPEIAEKTRVIHKSPTFGFPPMVSRIGVDKDVVNHMQSVLLGMKDDPEGREFLIGLKLDGFGISPSSLFDSIRDMANQTRKAQPWLATATESANGKKASP